MKNVESKIAFLLQEIRKIIKIVATICQIVRKKCTKIQFLLGLCPDPVGGEAYSASPDPLAGFKGAYFQRKGEDGREGQWKREKGEEGTGWRECDLCRVAGNTV